MDRSQSQISQTFFRGLKLLDLIAEGRGGYSVRQLAAELELPRSIVHRLICTLEAAGYLEKNSPKPGFRLGTKLWWLGCAAMRGLELKDIARPYLEDVASKTNELVNLVILDGQEVLYIDKIESSQAVRPYILIGGRAPAYCVATGKAILAYSGDDLVRKIRSSMKRFTKNTIVGSESFRRHLEDIRERGYAVNLGEFRGEVGGVAAAILSSDGVAVGAIGITSPVSRLSKMTVRYFGQLVQENAGQISSRLGYRVVDGNERKASAKW